MGCKSVLIWCRLEKDEAAHARTRERRSGALRERGRVRSELRISKEEYDSRQGIEVMTHLLLRSSEGMSQSEVSLRARYEGNRGAT